MIIVRLSDLSLWKIVDENEDKVKIIRCLGNEEKVISAYTDKYMDAEEYLSRTSSKYN